jgi:predicted ferric reductase
LTLLILIDAIAARLGLTGGLPKLDNSSLWLASRAAGMTAFVALTLDVVFGLLMSTRAADGWLARAHSVEIHRWLSSVSLTLIAVHALALTGERLAHFDAIDALVPFASTYRPLATGLGGLAAYGALVVHVSFGLRRRLGAATWRKLHFLSFAVFGLGLAHGFFAGSSSHRVGALGLYLASGAIVALLTLYRFLSPATARRAGLIKGRA